MENVSKDFVMKLVREGKSHEEISKILKTTYPSIVRGLSVRSVDFAQQMTFIIVKTAH